MSKPPAHGALQLSVTGLLMLVACVAFNLWLFRVGTLMGIIGLNVTKHVLIAYLCQVIGVNKAKPPASPVPPPRASGLPLS